MAKWVRPKPFEKKNGSSPFWNEMVVLCSRREFLHEQGKPGFAHRYPPSWICVCVCVKMYMYIYICIYIQLYIFIYVHIQYIYLYMCMYVCVCIYRDNLWLTRGTEPDAWCHSGWPAAASIPLCGLWRQRARVRTTVVLGGTQGPGAYMVNTYSRIPEARPQYE